MTQTIKFTVFGKPQQRGSKVAGARYDRDGKPITKDGRVLTFAKDSNVKSRGWMEIVSSAAGTAFSGELLDGPINLVAKFYFVRPSKHYHDRKGGRVLRADAPLWHTQTPDLSKLLRCLEDAITGVVWRDDKQIVTYDDSFKQWTDTQNRCELEIIPITGTTLRRSIYTASQLPDTRSEV